MPPRMVRPIFVAMFAALAISTAATPSSGGYAHLILDSTPGSYIGGGKDYDIIDSNAGAYTVYPSDNLPDGELTNIDFSVFQSSNVFASVEFSTHMLGIPLQVGQYNNAVRFPFENPGQAGLNVTFYDEGSNMLTGSFDITNATFYIDSFGQYQVATFAATFDQVSDNGTSHVSGSITYSATVPEPSSIILCAIAALAGLVSARVRQVLVA